MSPAPEKSAFTDVDGQPLSPEAVRALKYIRSRADSLSPREIRDRIRAAAAQLENAVASVSETEARSRPLDGKWTIAEVADHVAQTQIRAVEELRHLLAGRRPPGPPIYDGLRSGAAAWAPWPELVAGMQSANAEFVALLSSALTASDLLASEGSPSARTILIVNRTQPDGRTTPQLFAAELAWKEYALVQRVHLLDHRLQVNKLRAAQLIPPRQD